MPENLALSLSLAPDLFWARDSVNGTVRGVSRHPTEWQRTPMYRPDRLMSMRPDSPATGVPLHPGGGIFFRLQPDDNVEITSAYPRLAAGKPAPN
jgi:hypothetical protein